MEKLCDIDDILSYRSAAERELKVHVVLIHVHCNTILCVQLPRDQFVLLNFM